MTDQPLPAIMCVSCGGTRLTTEPPCTCQRRHPWPMGTAPTAVELLEWLREGPMHDEDDAIRYLDAILRDATLGHRCMVSDHDHGMRELAARTADATRWAIIRDHQLARVAGDPNREPISTIAKLNRLIEEATQ